MKQLLVFILCCSLVFPLQAQTPEERKEAGGTRRQLATIVFAGLGGAVLGLSTLSFYGRPQEYLSNIAVGFALGVIGGTIYATYNAASNPKDFYGEDKNTYLNPGLQPKQQDGWTVGYRWSF